MIDKPARIALLIDADNSPAAKIDVILAELAKEVYTIEISEPLGRRAAALLKGLGYGNVTVRIADGFFGWPELAPFSAIVVTCAPP